MGRGTNGELLNPQSRPGRDLSSRMHITHPQGLALGIGRSKKDLAPYLPTELSGLVVGWEGTCDLDRDPSAQLPSTRQQWFLESKANPLSSVPRSVAGAGMPKALCTCPGLDGLLEAGHPAGVASQAWALLTNSVRDGPGSG